MNKFALIGRDIAHSRSPEIYRKLISPNVHYDLLDYPSSVEIPSAQILLSQYDGINITSPYKQHFIKEVELTENAKKIGAINCLKKINGKIIGENTDYLAVVDIANELVQKYLSLEIIILGNGVMSKVVQVALLNLSLDSKVLSRKDTDNFNQVNLEKLFIDKSRTPLVINTCAREYVFRGLLPKNSVFWDFNYDFPQHSQPLCHKVQNYFDGFDMLERQAFYAVAFWSSRQMSNILK